MIDEKEIINIYKTEASERMDVLFEQYKVHSYRLCCHLVNDVHDADDLFQETWIRVVKNIRHYNSANPFETWLYVITINLYKDKYRKAKRWLNRIKDYFNNESKEIELSEVEGSNPPPEMIVIEKEMKEKLKNCVNRLDDIYRLPLVLYYFRDVDYAGISEVLGIPIGTVRSRLSSGKKKLKIMMEGGENNGRK